MRLHSCRCSSVFEQSRSVVVCKSILGYFSDSHSQNSPPILCPSSSQDAYRLIRDAGIRSEFLLGVLDKKQIELSSLVLKATDDTVMGSTDKFLDSKLRYVKDERGQEICMAMTENGLEVGVMMGWEKPISECTELLCKTGVETQAMRLNCVNFHSGGYCTKI